MPLIILPLLLFFLSTSVSYAATAAVKVSATVLKLNQCKFSTGDSALDLGVLDPESPLDRTITTSLIFKCAGSEATADFAINDDSGSLEMDPQAGRKMKHATMPDSSIPYEVSISKTGGEAQRNVDQSITISVKIKGEDYRNIYSGGYSDVVYISISP